jgi:hypothetical protein
VLFVGHVEKKLRSLIGTGLGAVPGELRKEIVSHELRTGADRSTSVLDLIWFLGIELIRDDNLGTDT